MREGRDIESNRISNEVRAISLDGNKYSSITENAENENNDQAMNVKNENRITPFSDNVPSGSSVNIPVPDIAAKIEPIIPSKATEKGMCGDRPSLEVKIVSNNEDRKWQSNTTRPTARGKSLPTRRSVIISKSSAFDTIQRKPLMNVLETILNEDERRMSRILLSNTSISIKFGKHRRENVKTNIGSPQGDGISGIFFNIALENALRTLRVDLNEKNQVERSSLPTEIIYADDNDFLSEDNSRSEVLKEIVKDCLGRFNLKVNEEKTEETAIKREQGKAEKWRWTKKLGSLLGDYQDMKRRKQLSIIAQASAKKLWMNKKVNIQTKLKIYKSIVKPVLTYNFATLALTKNESKELDCIHRKQLRQVWNDKRIHNKQLYEKSREKPLSAEMKEARWRTFGHILRLPTSTPCQQSMNYYFECPPKAKKFRGRKRITLPVLLDNDIVEAAKYHQRLQIRQFKTRKDLDILRHLADDRNGWKNLTNLICSVAQGEQ